MNVLEIDIREKFALTIKNNGRILYKGYVFADSITTEFKPSRVTEIKLIESIDFGTIVRNSKLFEE